MLKQFNELSVNTQKEVNKKVSELLDGSMLIIELGSNGEIVESISSSKLLDLGKFVGFTRYSEKCGGEYVKRDELVKFLAKSPKSYYFDYSKSMVRTPSQRVKKDSNIVINTMVKELINLKKSGKYSIDDVNHLIETNQTIEDYKSRTQSIQDALLRGDIATVQELGQGYDVLASNAKTEQEQIEKLLNTDKPSNYTEAEINTLLETIKERLTKVNQEIKDYRIKNDKKDIDIFDVNQILGSQQENQENKEEVVE